MLSAFPCEMNISFYSSVFCLKPIGSWYSETENTPELKSWTYKETEEGAEGADSGC